MVHLWGSLAAIFFWRGGGGVWKCKRLHPLQFSCGPSKFEARSLTIQLWIRCHTKSPSENRKLFAKKMDEWYPPQHWYVGRMIKLYIHQKLHYLFLFFVHVHMAPYTIFSCLMWYRGGGGDSQENFAFWQKCECPVSSSQRCYQWLRNWERNPGGANSP